MKGARRTVSSGLVSLIGATAGGVIACAAEDVVLRSATPVGIAANDGAIYVAYGDDDGLVLARVSP